MPRTGSTEDGEAETRVTRSLRKRINSMDSNTSTTPKRGARNELNKLDEDADSSISPSAKQKDEKHNKVLDAVSTPVKIRLRSAAVSESEKQSTGTPELKGTPRRMTRRASFSETLDVAGTGSPAKRVTRRISQAEDAAKEHVEPAAVALRLKRGRPKSKIIEPSVPEEIEEEHEESLNNSHEMSPTRRSLEISTKKCPNLEVHLKRVRIKLNRCIYSSPQKNTNSNEDKDKGEPDSNESFEAKSLSTVQTSPQKVIEHAVYTNTDMNASEINNFNEKDMKLSKSVSFNSSLPVKEKTPSRFPKTPKQSKTKSYTEENRHDFSSGLVKSCSSNEDDVENNKESTINEEICADKNADLNSNNENLPEDSFCINNSIIEKTETALDSTPVLKLKKNILSLSSSTPILLRNESNLSKVQNSPDKQSIAEEKVKETETNVLSPYKSKNIKSESLREPSKSPNIQMPVFSKSWSQSVKGQVLDKNKCGFIDGFGVESVKDLSNNKKSDNSQNWSKIKDDKAHSKRNSDELSQNSTESDNKDKDDSVENFLDIEAIENSDDHESIDSSEREYLKQNEIPEKGESIGSEDTDSDGENEEDENDSFIVSDEDESKLSINTDDNDLSLEENNTPKESKKNKSKTKKIDSSSDENDDKEQTPIKTVENVTASPNYDTAEEDADCKPNESLKGSDKKLKNSERIHSAMSGKQIEKMTVEKSFKMNASQSPLNSSKNKKDSFVKTSEQIENNLENEDEDVSFKSTEEDSVGKSFHDSSKIASPLKMNRERLSKKSIGSDKEDENGKNKSIKTNSESNTPSKLKSSNSKDSTKNSISIDNGSEEEEENSSQNQLNSSKKNTSTKNFEDVEKNKSILNISNSKSVSFESSIYDSQSTKKKRSSSGHEINESKNSLLKFDQSPQKTIIKAVETQSNNTSEELILNSPKNKTLFKKIDQNEEFYRETSPKISSPLLRRSFLDTESPSKHKSPKRQNVSTATPKRKQPEEQISILSSPVGLTTPKNKSTVHASPKMNSSLLRVVLDVQSPAKHRSPKSDNASLDCKEPEKQSSSPDRFAVLLSPKNKTILESSVEESPKMGSPLLSCVSSTNLRNKRKQSILNDDQESENITEKKALMHSSFKIKMNSSTNEILPGSESQKQLNKSVRSMEASTLDLDEKNDTLDDLEKSVSSNEDSVEGNIENLYSGSESNLSCELNLNQVLTASESDDSSDSKRENQLSKSLSERKKISNMKKQISKSFTESNIKQLHKSESKNASTSLFENTSNKQILSNLRSVNNNEVIDDTENSYVKNSNASAKKPTPVKRDINVPAMLQKCQEIMKNIESIKKAKFGSQKKVKKPKINKEKEVAQAAQFSANLLLKDIKYAEKKMKKIKPLLEDKGEIDNQKVIVELAKIKHNVENIKKNQTEYSSLEVSESKEERKKKKVKKQKSGENYKVCNNEKNNPKYTEKELPKNSEKTPAKYAERDEPKYSGKESIDKKLSKKKFVEEELESVTVPSKKKKRKILNAVLNISRGTDNFREESVTPKSKLQHGFSEEPVTPKPLGFKIDTIYPEIIERPKSTTVKRKLDLPEPLTVLPKPAWTTSGDFLVAKLPKKLHAEKYIKPSVSGSTTDFVVTTLNDNKSKYRRAESLSSATSHSEMNALRQFVENSRNNKKIHRETSKQILQRKQRQKIYKKY